MRAYPADRDEVLSAYQECLTLARTGQSPPTATGMHPWLVDRLGKYADYMGATVLADDGPSVAMMDELEAKTREALEYNLSLFDEPHD